MSATSDTKWKSQAYGEYSRIQESGMSRPMAVTWLVHYATILRFTMYICFGLRVNLKDCVYGVFPYCTSHISRPAYQSPVSIPGLAVTAASAKQPQGWTSLLTAVLIILDLQFILIMV
jgi:hypothetical protein